MEHTDDPQTGGAPPLDIARYQRARSIFDQVADLDRAARDGELARLCGGDNALRDLVRELLANDSSSALESDLGQLVERTPLLDPTRFPGRLVPGAQLDRYVVQRLLGVGGTAQVWELRHQTLGTPAALKVLIWAEPTLQRRLLREARAQARLIHPNIVPVTDVIDVGGTPGVLMPLIDGPPLDALLRGWRPTTGEAVAIFRGVVAGVAAAHDMGFAHRDLKPGNVMLEVGPGGVVPRVTDFGLVKGGDDRERTRTGVVMGTIVYAAPEQLLDSSAVDLRADLWSLGVVLYELLTGNRPFSGRTLDTIREAQLAGPDLSGLDPALAPIVGALLQPDPDQRLGSARALLARLPPGTSLGPDSGVARAVRAWRAREGGAAVATSTHSQTSLAPLAPPPAPAWRRLGPAVAALATVGVGLALGWPRQDPVPESAETLLTGENTAIDIGSEALSPPVAPARAVAPPPDEAPPQATPAEAAPKVTPASEALDHTQARAERAATSRQSPEAPPAEQAPTASAEAATPAEAAPVTPARVRVSGDQDSARLMSDDGKVYPPGPVPPGAYEFEAHLPSRGALITLDLGVLSAGQEVRITCSDNFGLCRVEGS